MANYCANAATDSTLITINGKVTDSENKLTVLQDLMIVNTTTQHGFFGKNDGTFSITVSKNDSVIIASTGYASSKFSMRDSAYAKNYNIIVRLKKLNVRLPEIRIMVKRDLDAIQKDIEKLGYRKEDYMLSGINPLESPITFLYQQFSRIERLKRHNAERINDEKRRDLLKELLANYVEADIIKLNNNDFDQFIDFASIPEETMKQLTQYDFCIHVKKQYQLYCLLRDKRQAGNEEPDYYKPRK